MTAALELYDALKSIGVDEARARSTAEKLDAALERRLTRDLANLATRDELGKLGTELRTEMAGLRTELRTEMADLRTEMADLRTELRTEMAGLRTEHRTETAELRAEMRNGDAGIRQEMSRLETRLIKWNVGTILAVAALTMTLVKLLG